MISQVQKTIVEQLTAQNRFFASEHDIKALVAMDDRNTIRLHHRGKETVNIDIRYNEGSDLYNVKAYRLQNHGLDVKTIYDEQGFYWDQLDTVIKTILRKAQQD